ncbi:hypothetical protein JHK86_025588 [Glycine max]|nr:hypothetical protein JHK86_025588 [Glycine max]
MSEMEEDSRAMVFTVARNIWYGRNQYVLQNRRLDFRQILAKANQNLPLCLMRDVPNAHSQRVPVGWKPPPEGTFKVKLNAAIRNNQGTSTHELASVAFSVIDYCWIEEVPHCLDQIILDDVSFTFPEV